MKRMVRIAYVCLIPLTIAAAGCESVSLIDRGDPYARRDRGDRDVDRNREARRDRDGRGDRDLARDEVIGTVQRVDQDRQEIQLRNSDGQMMRIRYDRATRVYHRDRDLRVNDLRNGDLVRVELDSDNRGDRYAEVIRMNDRS